MKSRLEAAVERARKAHRGDSTSEIKSALDELTAAYQEAGRSLYAQAQPEQPTGSGAEAGGDGAKPEAGEKKPDDVVEADYEIVDEKKS
jgi:molecular chaperone DnaK